MRLTKQACDLHLVAVSTASSALGSSGYRSVTNFEETCGPIENSWLAAAALVDRIREGEQDALWELYSEVFKKGVRNLIIRRIGPCSNVDDMVHDAYLITVNAIRGGSIREPQRLLGFIRGVVRHLIYRHVSDRTRRNNNFVDLDLAERTLGEEAPQEVSVIEKRKVALMRKVLNELPARDREVLRRFYLLEQSMATICEEMGLTETQFRLLKSRAKAKLAQLAQKRMKTESLFTAAFRAGLQTAR